jgi:hypothetical protein
MKQFILTVFVLIASFSSFAQNKHTCEGITKAGLPCQHKTATMYCKQHNPVTPKCSDSTKLHQRCKMPVKQEGDKCHIHSKAHACRWDLCPYKGVTLMQSKKAVSAYTGETGTDAYRIDMLHIKYPALDADQLDSLLTSK